MYKSIAMIFLLFVLHAPSTAAGAVLTSDTVWSGEVSISEDILVPEGVTLTVMPGRLSGFPLQKAQKWNRNTCLPSLK
jgi:hypothetical protein